MALKCPPGWEMVSQPSTPKNYERYLPDYRPGLSLIRYYNRMLLGLFEWVPAEVVLPVQGACSEKFTFTGGFTVETNSAHTINVGALFNLPGIGEAGEISGGYSYTWGGAQISGSGLETTVGPETCWEYMAVPVVLKFTVCESWSRTGAPWWDYLGVRAERMFPGSIQSGMACEKPLYLRGGLMVCRHWCCENAPPSDQAGIEH